MLRLEKITKSFASSHRPILTNISFTLAPQDFCIVLGANGSGKSTMLKTISGEYRPDQGRVFLDDLDITDKSLDARAHDIASVSQDITLGTILEMTLFENLALGRMRGRAATFGRYHEQDISLASNLKKFMHTPLKALSGGQRQMIAMEMALAAPAKILLLDEHCSALDPKSAVHLMEHTTQMVKTRQIPTLMITHNMSDALLHGNRLIMLHEGQIVADYKGSDKASLSHADLMDLFKQRDVL